MTLFCFTWRLETVYKHVVATLNILECVHNVIAAYFSKVAEFFVCVCLQHAKFCKHSRCRYREKESIHDVVANSAANRVQSANTPSTRAPVSINL